MLICNADGTTEAVDCDLIFLLVVVVQPVIPLLSAVKVFPSIWESENCCHPTMPGYDLIGGNMAL